LLLELNRKAFRYRSLLDYIAASHMVSWDHKTSFLYVEVCRPATVHVSCRRASRVAYRSSDCSWSRNRISSCMLNGAS